MADANITVVPGQPVYEVDLGAGPGDRGTADFSDIATYITTTAGTTPTGPDRFFGMGYWRTEGVRFINAEHFTVIAAGGNDVLTGAGGDDHFSGGAGNDTLDGSTGADTLLGQDGDDRLVAGTGGPDRLDGGAGNDYAILDRSDLTVSVVFTFDAGAAAGFALPDGSVVAGIERLDYTASAQNDTVTVTGYHGNGNSQIDLGEGTDRGIADLSGYTLNIATNPGSTATGPSRHFSTGYWSDNGVRFINTEHFTVIGGSGNDRLVGAEGEDRLEGRDGDDWLQGATGRDTLLGGTGNDTLIAGPDGPDEVQGGAGLDELQSDRSAGTAAETFVFDGRTGARFVMADGTTVEGIERLVHISGSGDDSITVRTEHAQGNSIVDMSGGSDRGLADMGAHTLDISTSVGSTATGPSRHFSTGYWSDNGIRFINTEHFSVIGGSGNDHLVGSTGNDMLSGQDGADRLDAASGIDTLIGGDGDDIMIAGAQGPDVIDGGAGIDELTSDRGAENAAETFVFDAAGDVDFAFSDGTTVSGVERLIHTTGGGDDTVTVIATHGHGNSIIDMSDGTDRGIADLSRFTLGISTSSGSTATGPHRHFSTGYWSDNGVRFINAEQFSVTGGTGADLLIGDDGGDFFAGGDGNDRLLGGAGNDTLRGDGGEDRAEFAVSSADVAFDSIGEFLQLTSAEGIDQVHSSTETLVFTNTSLSFDEARALATVTDQNRTGTPQADTMTGDRGDDTLNGIEGDDSIIGNAGDDSLEGGAGDDTIEGGVGSDTLTDTAGNDLLSGGAGDDDLTGGPGNDTIIGGSDNDVARFGVASTEIAVSLSGTAVVIVSSEGTDRVVFGTERFVFGDREMTWDEVVAMAPGQAGGIGSVFDADTEAWVTSNGTQSHVANGGDPDGYLRGTEGGSGVWTFIAPEPFLGDMGQYYGGTLTYSQKQDQTENQFDDVDVRLDGAGLSLVADAGDNPGTDWTGYSLNLTPGAGWRVGSLSGRIATATEISSVLSDLERLQIRGEFVDGSQGDASDLDSVAFATGTPDPVYGGGPSVVSTFDEGIEGWSFINDVREFRHVPDNGNPGGYLEAVDYATGETWYYVAPTVFLGDKSSFYGGRFGFDLRQSATTSQFQNDDVVLTGGGQRLVHAITHPGTDWTSYSLSLGTEGDWRLGSESGAVATESQIRAVLASLDSLLVRGEFVSGDDTGGLDNVVLSAAGAVTLYSAPQGGEVLGRYASLQTAIDNAAPGQRIDIAGSALSGPVDAGTDNLVFSADAPFATQIRLTGAAAAATLRGTAAMNVAGNDNANSIGGNAGDNRLDGGAGADILFGGLGNDTIDGGADADEAVFGVASTSVTVTQDGGALLIESAEGRDRIEPTVETLRFSDTTLGFADVQALIAAPGDQRDGTSGDDLMRGTERADTLSGLEGNDTLLGLQADDVLFGGPGHDVIDGAAGADRIAGGDGNDHLLGDGFKIAFAGDVSAQVFRLYQATLDRAPDAAGHMEWSAQIYRGALSGSDAAAGFVGSPEFQNVYGALDNAAFVELLYRNVLNRAPDADGLAAWTALLGGGMSRADVVLGFSDSPEFITATRADAGAFATGHTDSIWSDDVYRLYQATLDRAPDLAGFIGWTDALGSGTPFATAVNGFVASVEFQNTYGALDDRGFVNLLYNNVLGRDGDAAGLQGWLNILAEGGTRETVVEGFSQSPEFVNATAANLTAWMRAQGDDDVLDGGGGRNVLTGGRMSDTFVFAAGDAGNHRVLDLEAWDTLAFRDFGYAAAADARAHLAQTGADVTFSDQGTDVVFQNTALALFDDDMFVF